MSIIRTDINIRNKNTPETNLNINRNNIPETNINIKSSGGLPGGGLPGQVLTKLSGSAVWEDMPIRIPTISDLPNNPSIHTLYLIVDQNDLVYYDGQDWVRINREYALAYDENEEALYLNVI